MASVIEALHAIAWKADGLTSWRGADGHMLVYNVEFAYDEEAVRTESNTVLEATRWQRAAVSYMGAGL